MIKSISAHDIVFTSQVLKTLRELPANKRTSVTSALITDLILGEDSADSLSEFDYLIYSLIAENIKRDSYKIMSQRV